MEPELLNLVFLLEVKSQKDCRICPPMQRMNRITQNFLFWKSHKWHFTKEYDKLGPLQCPRS